MALEIKQHLRLAQQLIMTPQLQQAIKLLQLSRLELINTIREEMEINPLLDEVEIEESPEEILKKGEDTASASRDEQTSEAPLLEGDRSDFDWAGYLNDYYKSSGLGSYYEEKEPPSLENISHKGVSLQSHLMWQLRLSNFSEKEQEIGTLIIGNLDSDGYLRTTGSEIATISHTDEETVERVLKKVQEFDPLGVAARNLKECLLIQAIHLNLDNTIVGEIIKNHLHQLENKNYKAIAKALKVSIEDVTDAIRVILQMEPKPGRLYSDEESQYIIPDIFVYKTEDEFLIVLNEDGLPKLKINRFYEEILKDKNLQHPAREYIQNKVQSAIWLIRSIHQRQRTVYKVTESIIKFQRDFLEKGIGHLKPLVLRDVAEDVGMHESTISRVTTNKYMYTTQGIFELKYFFNSAIQRTDGDTIASQSVKEQIRKIIQSEDSKNPYSDKHIAEILKKSNINIARRTVAKYREIMGILPSSKRKTI